MAQIAEGDIKVGLTRAVGKARVDPGRVRGEAGPWEPRLVIPVEIQMNPRPSGEQLALIGLTGRLHIGEVHNPTTQVGLPAAASLILGFHARSIPHGPSSHYVDLRVPLSMPAVARLEAARHASAEDDLTLGLKLEGPLVWIKNTRGESYVSPGKQPTIDTTDPFKMQFGLHSDLSFFWTSEIDPLRLQIDKTVWINNVLPGLGVNTVRLVEMVLPPALPDVGNPAKVFDEAQRAYHEKRYEDCIGKCRGIIQAWNKQLTASKARHLAEIVGDVKKWPADDLRRALLDAIWQSLMNASNVPHHPGDQDRYLPTEADARLHLMLTALISEYLHNVLG